MFPGLGRRSPTHRGRAELSSLWIDRQRGRAMQHGHQQWGLHHLSLAEIAPCQTQIADVAGVEQISQSVIKMTQAKVAATDSNFDINL